MSFISRFNKTSQEDISFKEEIFKTKPYFQTTNNIAISVWPEFIDHKFNTAEEIYIWAYHVIIENKSNVAVQLVNRHWKIIDENGHIDEVSGEGVVGKKPTIDPYKSFQYTSGVHLTCPSGIMTGKYEMKKNNEEFFYAQIPSFSLDIPNVKNCLN